jgi:hypothetical protein
MFFHHYYFHDAMCLVPCVLLVHMDNIIHYPFHLFIESLLSLRRRGASLQHSIHRSPAEKLLFSLTWSAQQKLVLLVDYKNDLGNSGLHLILLKISNNALDCSII